MEYMEFEGGQMNNGLKVTFQPDGVYLAWYNNKLIIETTDRDKFYETVAPYMDSSNVISRKIELM